MSLFECAHGVPHGPISSDLKSRQCLEDREQKLLDWDLQPDDELVLFGRRRHGASVVAISSVPWATRRAFLATRSCTAADLYASNAQRARRCVLELLTAA